MPKKKEEEIKADETQAEETPVEETPVPEEPVAEETPAEEPVAEEPVAEETPAEEPVPEEPVAAEEPVAEPEFRAIDDEPSSNGDGASLTEPSPEMTEMFREQLQSMKSSGKTRQEAERSLLRFNVGRRCLGLLDEIYGEDTGEATPSGEQQRKGRMRSFFSR